VGVGGTLLLLDSLEMSSIILYGLLSIVLMSTMKEGCYGMNWYDCFVGGIFHGALGVILYYHFLSKRLCDSQSSPAVVEFSEFICVLFSYALKVPQV
jgi:hypothetical protein